MSKHVLSQYLIDILIILLLLFTIVARCISCLCHNRLISVKKNVLISAIPAFALFIKINLFFKKKSQELFFVRIKSQVLFNVIISSITIDFL